MFQIAFINVDWRQNDTPISINWGILSIVIVSCFFLIFRECDWYVLLDTEKDDLNPETLNWICKKCNSTRTAANAQSVVQRIMTDLDAMDKNDEKSCKLFLDHYGKSNLLHPNHFILTEVRLSLAQLHGQKTDRGIQEIPDADLEHKTELCKQVLKLARQLFVG